jgi:hypothetical protein
MNKQRFLDNISKIHDIFNQHEAHYNSLSNGVNEIGLQREILDDFLEALWLEKNPETYYAAAVRIGDKKFEPLDVYLEKINASREKRDELFESSYNYVRAYYEKLQWEMIDSIEAQELLPEFYLKIFQHTHKIWKLYSTLFLKWNRALLFETNRDLEIRFDNDQDKINSYISENDLMDLWHRGESADRTYSILISEGDSHVSKSYGEIFPEEVWTIISAYDEFITDLEKSEDEVFDKKNSYIEYFTAIKNAWSQQDVNKLVAAWSEVDVKWMAIDTPVQPGHPIEYYEDKYRRAVSIEFDIRLVDPSLFTSQVAADIENMYEGMYDEIGRENFPESYEFSKNNQKQVQLYIWAPVLAYGSFLCGAYSAQVVPNDDVVSKVHGKKIFAFPKYVLEAQKSAPRMKLDSKLISEEILEKYRKFLDGREEDYYKIYDIETIGHEFGHTLWLTPWSEVKMWETGLLKNIEEFKATAGGLVAYFLKWASDLDEAVVVTHLMRSIKIMRYREVEDILPYYCECLIHLHILFASGIISFESWKIELHMHEQNLTALREMYIWVYTQEIFTYLNQMDAGNFLFEFALRENWVFLPKDYEVRNFVEEYYKQYKRIWNEVL